MYNNIGGNNRRPINQNYNPEPVHTESMNPNLQPGGEVIRKKPIDLEKMGKIMEQFKKDLENINNFKKTSNGFKSFNS